MKFHILLFLISLTTFACNNTDTPNISVPPKATLSQPQKQINSADQAEIWLIEAIEQYFSTSTPAQKKITTPRYFEYKNDAINVDLDGGLTSKEFADKWGANYDTHYAGIGSGFLISGQDYGKIIVSYCKLKESKSDTEYTFDIKMEDNQFNAVYKREIKVVFMNDKFLIDDVKEFE